MPSSSTENLLNLDESADDGLNTAQPQNTKFWNRIHAKHAIVGMMGIGLILTTITLIQLSTISYALIQVQQTLPDTISGYTDGLLQNAETIIERQIDDVVKKVGNDIKNTFYTDIEDNFIPKITQKIQEQFKELLYDEFGSETQFRDMVMKLEKLVTYACVKYPDVC
jgi:hypothetical protein